MAYFFGAMFSERLFDTVEMVLLSQCVETLPDADFH